MKNHKKILFILISTFVLLIFRISRAQIALEVPIPGMGGSVDDLGDYIRILYNYGIYAASVMAVIMISINGFKWVAAGGNQSTISKAKSGVITSISGLFLLFASYMILNTVNNKLTLLQMPKVEPIIVSTLDLKEASTVGLDPSYYDPNLYIQDIGHDSEGGGLPVAVTICGTGSQRNWYRCIPFSVSPDFSYEYSASIISSCQDMEQCVKKSSACTKYCISISSCPDNKRTSGYCDGSGGNICCKVQS